ncbi:MAG: cation-efflux pump [Candidatus Bathyarchaeota archaeon]|nr:cation-efflux pump [Candidatus Bathyarchaeota archaeon]MDW8039980.1 cation-efflux pump [Nitrososphaerota archaeon]
MRIVEERLKALKISTFAITSVIIVELTLGLAVGSLAIISDAAHALLDAVSMFILLLATKASLEPSDEEHMYGHEKFEPLGGLVGGLILFGTALFLIVSALQKIIHGELYIVREWTLAGFAAIAYTLCVDFLRLKVLHKVRKDSATAKAGFYHSFADLGSTIVALFGFGMATLGFPIFDALASIILSGIIGFLSVKLVKASGMELSDAISKDLVEKVRNEIKATDGVLKVINLRVRKAGAKIFVEAAIKVPDFMSLEESHAVTSKVEENLKRILGVAEVVIHVEPLGKEMLTEKLVEKLSKEIEGVKDVHDVNVVYSKGKLYLTLHAQVDPDLSVHEAHELAERIEQKLSQKIENVGNVTVHIEPFDSKVQRGPELNEEEIQQIIYMVTKTLQGGLSVRRVVTYVAGGRRYINIDCCFTGEVSVEEAHNVASKIEDAVKKKFTETNVTVHVEPENFLSSHTPSEESNQPYKKPA